jgi:hypothetical protein
MNKARRRFLKLLSIVGIGALVGLPGIEMGDDNAAAATPTNASPPLSGGRFYSPRGGCTEAGLTLLDKGPTSNRFFATFN